MTRPANREEFLERLPPLLDIAAIEPSAYSARQGHPVAGERVFMRDGSVWFHPYSGAPPICEVARDQEEF